MNVEDMGIKKTKEHKDPSVRETQSFKPDISYIHHHYKDGN